MVATKQPADLVQTVAALAERLDQQREIQQTILTVLNELLATNQAQSEMLADILDAAAQETGPSPVAQALEALAGQVQQIAETQTRLLTLAADLPEAVGRQFETSLKDWSTAGATSTTGATNH